MELKEVVALLIRSLRNQSSITQKVGSRIRVGHIASLVNTDYPLLTIEVLNVTTYWKVAVYTYLIRFTAWAKTPIEADETIQAVHDYLQCNTILDNNVILQGELVGARNGVDPTTELSYSMADYRFTVIKEE